MHLNSIFLGDCKDILKNVSDESVDLIYLDPPFNTKREQKLSTRDGNSNYSFEDSWPTNDSYRKYMSERLFECKRVLKDTGSIFLHCDKSASHHLRLVLDEVFGEENFQSEIIWSYRRWSNSKKGLLNNHQNIYFYSKTSEFKFNQHFENYSPSTNVDQIVQLRSRDKRNKSTYQKDESGNVVLCNEKKGVPMGDVWDIPFLNPKAKERVGYPTQKPILLLEKILDLASSPGDLILDPFCGSGSTLVAAKLLNRNFIGIDKNSEAVEISRERILNPIKTESNLLKAGRDSYKNQNVDVENVLKSLGATVVQRNKGIDGFITTEIGITPVRVRRSNETLEEAISLILKASLKNSYKKQIIIENNESKENLSNLNKKYPSVEIVETKGKIVSSEKLGLEL